MKDKKYIAAGLVITLIFVATLFFYSKQDENTAIGVISFESIDLQGEAVSDSIFENYDLTMINIWGTYCSPCIEELPDIEELYGEMKDQKVNIIGIVSDVDYSSRDQETFEEAQGIVEELGITYANILPDESIESKLLNRIVGVPTTIFVDKDGNIVGKMVTGGRSKLEYQKLIEEYLAEIKKAN